LYLFLKQCHLRQLSTDQDLSANITENIHRQILTFLTIAWNIVHQNIKANNHLTVNFSSQLVGFSSQWLDPVHFGVW